MSVVWVHDVVLILLLFLLSRKLSERELCFRTGINLYREGLLGCV